VASRVEALAASVPAGISVRPAENLTKPDVRERRDELLRRIATEQYAGVDLRQVVDEIATDIRRYETTQWRFDRRLEAKPPGYAPHSLRARLFEAFQAAGGRVPASPKQLRRILKPLFQQSKRGTTDDHCDVPNAGVSLNAMRKQQMAEAALALVPDQKLLRAIADSPSGKAAASKLAADELAERKRLAAALVDLEKEALSSLPAGREDKADQEAELKAARERVRALEIKLFQSSAGKVGASFAFQARRDELEAKLRATASPLIAAFIREMRQAADETRKEQPRDSSAITRSPFTGRLVGTPQNNMAAIVLRMHAIRRAIEDAEQLYFVPDQSGMAEQLKSIKQKLPSTAAMSPPPRYGSSELLSDLNNGMALKAALAKHCPEAGT
jgi:hypothetical protein